VATLAVGSLVLFASVYWLAFNLRFDFAVPSEWIQVFLVTLPWVLGIKLAVFYTSGHYHGGWSYVSFADLVALLRAALLSLAIIALADHFLFPHQIPRAVLLMDCVMTILILGATRASRRMLIEHAFPAFRSGNYKSALLIGVDHSTGLLANHINSQSELGYRIHGFLTADGLKTGQRLGQIPVLGSLDEVTGVAAAHGVRTVLLIAGTIEGRRTRWLMDECDKGQLTLKIIPPLGELFNSGRSIPIRDLEIGDLLRRAPVKPDVDVIRDLIGGRRVLVTGAGGSIGSEICRQALKFGPSELVLLGRGENRIFFIEKELRGQDASTKLCPVIGDITDADRMRHVFEEFRPEVVLHAAAHKHVPLMEVNVGEAIKNNVLGTKRVADLSDEFGVKNFVLISTDKAVNPSSVMGATKHLAERYVQVCSEQSATLFVVVRFGNVLGSAGSVVPIFQDQIRRGGPITVTDPRMTRYFMTIPEAAQLVLQASAMGEGGEIFVLDMGEPVNIVNLAHDLIRLSGLPTDAIDITFPGIRPGEKLEEELYFGDERTRPTAHAKVRLAEPRYSGVSGLPQLVSRFENAVGETDELLRVRLHEAVPEYQPPDTPCRADRNAIDVVGSRSYSQLATGEEAAL
jgi:FlaA1/EpsC-like NDP-sugar epimerase